MKKLLLILSLFAACFAGAQEHQRNAFGPIPLLITAAELQVTNPIVGSTTLDTNAPTVQSDLNDIIAHLVSTNWYFAAYYLHAPGLQHKEGGSIAGFTPLSQYVLAGWRVDYVNGNFWMPSGQATLQLPITPIKSWQWLTVTPFGFVGVGIPLSGAHVSGVVIPGQVPRDNNGQPTAILGIGGAISLWKNSNPTSHWRSVSIVADKETWTGFPGQQFRIGFDGHFTF